MSAPCIPLKRSCPKCKSQTIQVNNQSVQCTECDWNKEYDCPVCNQALGPNDFQDAPSQFSCPKCQLTVPLKKIKSILDNGLMVDHQTRCELCNGPTLHRKDVNIAHRCLFYPKCSGQADLFGGSRESLTFLDFETTGLEVGKNSIIEIGALRIDEDGDEETFSTFVDPETPISSKITSITGITDEMVAGAPLIAESIKDLNAFIGSSKIVAHNSAFDIPWFMVALEQLGLKTQCTQSICTLKWAKENVETHCSLGALTRKYGIPHDNAHRALADAVATKELFFIFENQKKSPRPIRDLSTFNSQVQTVLQRSKSTTPSW
ncbi:3'-5' exonuclease [bacterium]|jgi:DNA polymerase III epsilon subunit family exonuclease|nr:3'-5' exonuclease [bacterium]